MNEPESFNPEKNQKVLKEKIRRKKNFLPGVLVSTVLLISWLVVFFLVPPEAAFAPVAFLLITFCFLFFVFSLLLENSRRGFLVAIGITFFLITRYFGIGNYLILVLIVGILFTIEYYLSTH